MQIARALFDQLCSTWQSLRCSCRRCEAS